MNLGPLHWEHRVLATGPPGKSLVSRVDSSSPPLPPPSLRMSSSPAQINATASCLDVWPPVLSFSSASSHLLIYRSDQHSLQSETLQCLLIVSKFLQFSSVTHSCPTLCDPMDCSPPGSSVHGILQARILEWVAFPLPGIFLTQGLNLHLLYWQVDSLQLSHLGSPATTC